MKPAPLLLSLPFLFPVFSAVARPLAKPEPRADGLYKFRDAGRGNATFRIAKDELQESSTAGPRKVLISAKDHLRKVQKAAKDLSSQGKQLDLVAYEEGKPQTEENRRIVTPKVTVTLQEGIDPTALRQSINAISIRDVFYAPRDYILEFPDATEALTAAEALRAVPGVIKASVLLAEKKTPRYIPNDPWFTFTTGGTYRLYANSIGDDYAELKVKLNPIPVVWFQPDTRAIQWYFDRIGSSLMTPGYPTPMREAFYQTYKDSELPPYVEPAPDNYYYRYFDGEIDINVQPAWDLRTVLDSPIDGSGVRVAIMDDGVYLDHPDFAAPNIDRQHDQNFLDGKDKKDDPVPPFLNGFRPSHGTSIAGLVLAERDNNLGITGVAPDAKLLAYRLIGGFIDPATFADGMVWGAELEDPRTTTNNPDGLPTGNEWRRGVPWFDISVNSWGPTTGGAALRGQDLYLRKALAYGVTKGRVVNGTPRGIIYVFAAGNDGENHGDVNMDYTANSIYTLAIGGISDLGRRIAYSTPGAALNAVAPTGGGEMAPRVTSPATATPPNTLVPATIPPPIPTTDKQRAMGWTVTPDEWDDPGIGAEIPARLRATQQILTLEAAQSASTNAAEYNQDFSGTSASAALASGVVALMLEANPELGWRDVQEIIMRSAKVVDPLMGEWEYNHMGMPMSHKYGAGLIDAFHAVSMAKVWKNLGMRAGLTGTNIGTIDYQEYKGDVKVLTSGNTGNLIPDNAFDLSPKQDVTISVPAPNGLRVEHVVVRIKIEHGRRGDLGIMLISPDYGQSGKPVESYLYVPHREDFGSNIGRPDLNNGPSDADVEEGEYWDFMTVRHWGTGIQNTSLTPTAPAVGNWTLKVWDNTKQGTSTYAPTDKDPQKRVQVNVGNPTTPARLKYAAVIFHGTTDASQNEPPVVNNGQMLGLFNSPFQGQIKATSDTSAGPDGIAQRAPIYDYRIRVLGNTATDGEELIIAPNTAEEYYVKFPTPDPLPNPAPTTSPAHLRFDRTTGILTSDPYPGNPPGILPFKKLPAQSWNIELRATNIFGTTRRQIVLKVVEKVTYFEWKQIYFTDAQLANSTISGDLADPDFDGIPNLLEYAVGGTPFIKDPTLLPTSTVAEPGTIYSRLVYTYKVDTRASGFPVVAEVSSLLNPLASWTTLTSTLKATEGTIQTWQAEVPFSSNGPRQFIRLRAGARPTTP